MAGWFWLLHGEAVVRLENVVFTDKKRRCLTYGGSRTENSTLRLWKFVFGSIDPVCYKAFLLALNWWKIKLSYVYHYNQKLYLKYSDRLASHYHRKFLLKVLVALNTCSGSSCGPVDLWTCGQYKTLGPQQRISSKVLFRPSHQIWEGVAPWVWSTGRTSSWLKYVSGWLIGI